MGFRKAFLYVLFALFAATTNLVTQATSLSVYHGDWALFLSMGFGTLTGVAVKFMLDKTWVFSYRTISIRDGIKKFLIYSMLSIFTTSEFWLIELLFDYLIKEPWSKFVGGAIGLGLGYSLKYALDKRFVFTQTQARESHLVAHGR